MLAKVLICSCFVEKFHNEDHEYVKKLCHFRCKCNDSHIVYIFSCEKHPYVASKIPEMDPNCKCQSIDALEICNFCRQVRYLLNFRAFMFCLKRIPGSFQDHIVTTYQYFKECRAVNLFSNVVKSLVKLTFI